MSVNNKRVFYVKYLAHPIYTDILQGAARMCGSTGSRTKAPTTSPRRSWRRRMSIRSAPHATNSRRISMSTAILLKRTPNLLLVSSNGAGFDPVDVEACTEAGVLVVNQSGGNAQFGGRTRARRCC